MANTSDMGRAPPGDRTSGRGSGIVVAGDRTHSFRAARRHSSRVRVLRWTLPVVAACVLSLYAVTVLRTSDLVASLPEVAIPDILPDNLTMDNPHYEGFGKDGSAYTVRAKTAQQSLEDTSLVRLNGIEGALVEPDQRKTELKAARGLFNHTTSLLELEEAIDIASATGLRAKLTQATVKTKDGLITSSKPVLVEFPGGSVNANSLSMRHKDREITFSDAVKARMQPPQKSKAEEGKTAEAAGPFAASNAPVDITSRTLQIRDRDKLAVFSGEVVAVQGESVLSTPELEVHYQGAATDTGADAAQKQGANNATDPAAKPAAKSGALPGTGKLSRIIAKAPVTMSRGATDKVTCERADFDTAASKGVLEGQVVMTSGVDRRALADRADLDSAAGTALLTGAVVVTSGKNELKGRRLFIDNKAKRMQLSTPGGRIAARFVQAERKAKPGKPAAPAPAAGIATFKTDPDAPVDIDAETLEANDVAKTAIFRGKVKAVQGGFTILTPELISTYNGEAGLDGMAGASGGDAAKPEAAKPAAQLTRIEAKKKVTVTSADGQTVNGDWAIFDTVTSTVTVGGDVLLSEGKNVIRGTQLVIDMQSGQSRIETAGGGAPAKGEGWQAPSGSGPGGTPAQGRPSAVFYPDQLRSMRGDNDKKTEKADPWKSSTKPQP